MRKIITLTPGEVGDFIHCTSVQRGCVEACCVLCSLYDRGDGACRANEFNTEAFETWIDSVYCDQPASDDDIGFLSRPDTLIIVPGYSE